MSVGYQQLSDNSRLLVLAVYSSILLVFVVSTVLMPSCGRQPNVLIMLLHVIPLLCFLPGLLTQNVRSYVWLCFLSLGYFLVAVPNAFGCQTVLNILEPVLISVMFIAAMFYVRWRSRALAQS